MKWVFIKDRHINTDMIQVFRWYDGDLYVYYAGDDRPSLYKDSKKEKYYKLCLAIGVRPNEENTQQ